jgi:hypothetical protein
VGWACPTGKAWERPGNPDCYRENCCLENCCLENCRLKNCCLENPGPRGRNPGRGDCPDPGCRSGDDGRREARWSRRGPEGRPRRPEPPGPGQAERWRDGKGRWPDGRQLAGRRDGYPEEAAESAGRPGEAVPYRRRPLIRVHSGGWLPDAGRTVGTNRAPAWVRPRPESRTRRRPRLVRGERPGRSASPCRAPASSFHPTAGCWVGRATEPKGPRSGARRRPRRGDRRRDGMGRQPDAPVQRPDGRPRGRCHQE